MIYTLTYHPAIKQDYGEIDPSISIRIRDSLKKKLSTQPLQYGEYLHGKLHPYRKLRIGEYRVVYRVYEKHITVYVIAIGHRRNEEVYQKALERIITSPSRPPPPGSSTPRPFSRS